MNNVACPRFVCSALLAAAFVCGWAPAAFGQASPGVDAGSRVDLVLERGRFLEPLPFDVQFYLYGVAPPDLVYAKGRFAWLTKQLRKCEEVLPPKEPPSTVITPVVPPPENVPTQPVARRDDPKPPPIFVIDVARPFVDGGKSVFELSVDPLKPNKEYCFEFELFYKLDDEVVRAIGVAGIDRALRILAAQTAKVADPKNYDRVREEIVNAIEAERARKSEEKGITLEIIPTAGAFFDLSVPAIQLPATFRREFDTAIETQSAKFALDRQVGTAAGNAAAAAEELFTHPSFKRMIQQVGARSTTPALALRLTGLNAALGAASRPEIERSVRAEGVTAADRLVTPPLRETWEPAAIDARLANLDDSVREFEALAGLARDLAEAPGLRRAAGLDPASPAGNPNAIEIAELETVKELAEVAQERFEIVRNTMELLQTSLRKRAATIATMTDQLRAESSGIVPFRGTTMGNWKTRASQYISVDVGVASAPAIDSTFFYVGTNFYTGPVNKRAHLSWRDQSLRKRLAFLFAIPLNPFEDTQTDQFANAPRTIEGVIGDRPLLIGAGWRLTDVVRLSAGTVLFKVKGANPLVDDEPEPHFTWFMSMSVDWDIKHFFSGLTGTTPGQEQ